MKPEAINRLMTPVQDFLLGIASQADLGALEARMSAATVRVLDGLAGRIGDAEGRLDIHADQISELMAARANPYRVPPPIGRERARAEAGYGPNAGDTAPDDPMRQPREGLILPDPARDAANLAALANWTNANAWGKVSDDATANARVTAMLDHLHGLVAIAITGGEVPQPDGAES